jgi:hypothetical protein
LKGIPKKQVPCFIFSEKGRNATTVFVHFLQFYSKENTKLYTPNYNKKRGASEFGSLHPVHHGFPFLALFSSVQPPAAELEKAGSRRATAGHEQAGPSSWSCGKSPQSGAI